MDFLSRPLAFLLFLLIPHSSIPTPVLWPPSASRSAPLPPAPARAPDPYPVFGSDAPSPSSIPPLFPFPGYLPSSQLYSVEHGVPAEVPSLVSSPPPQAAEYTTTPETGIQIASYGDVGIHSDPRQLYLETLYYDSRPKCRTEYKTEHDTTYESTCQEVYTQDCITYQPPSTCRTVYEDDCSLTVTQCQTKYEQECRPEPAPTYDDHCVEKNSKKCFKKYKTTYTEECNNEYEDLCTVITVTKFVDDCGSSGHHPYSLRACEKLPVTKEVEKCAKVPRRSCKRTPFRRPETFCADVPVKHCSPVQRLVQKEHCQLVPKQVCEDVPQCRKVPREVCPEVPAADCTPQPRIHCQNVPKIVPVKVAIQICDQ